MKALVGAAVAAALATPALADRLQILPNGSQPSLKGPDATFSGSVRVDPQFIRSENRLSVGHVTFEPGARSAWHTHPAGQILIVTYGAGWTQEWGQMKRSIKAGDVVWIPAGVKHWHGAAASTSLSHHAIQEAVDGKNVDWMEKVTDEQYDK